LGETVIYTKIKLLRESGYKEMQINVDRGIVATLQGPFQWP